MPIIKGGVFLKRIQAVYDAIASVWDMQYLFRAGFECDQGKMLVVVRSALSSTIPILSTTRT